jgi:hypothetical protein
MTDRTEIVPYPSKFSTGNTKVPLMTDCITPTGGGYFFTPSISALKYLVGAIED